jgi:hypothetical protein
MSKLDDAIVLLPTKEMGSVSKHVRVRHASSPRQAKGKIAGIHFMHPQLGVMPARPAGKAWSLSEQQAGESKTNVGFLLYISK